MFRVYNDSLRLVELLQPLIEKVRGHSAKLATQLEGARISVPLNVAEGNRRRGGHRRERFETAMGSARECAAALDVAIAVRFVTREECAAALDVADKVVATLWCCLQGRKQR